MYEHLLMFGLLLKLSSGGVTHICTFNICDIPGLCFPGETCIIGDDCIFSCIKVTEIITMSYGTNGNDTSETTATSTSNTNRIIEISTNPTCPYDYRCFHGYCDSVNPDGTGIKCVCENGWKADDCNTPDEKTECLLSCPTSFKCVTIFGNAETCLPEITTPKQNTPLTLTTSGIMPNACRSDYILRPESERRCSFGLECRYGRCEMSSDTSSSCQCDPGSSGLLCQYLCCLDCGDYGECYHDNTDGVFCNCMQHHTGEVCELLTEGVRLTINPATVTIGGESITSTPVPTTSPPEVVLECTTEDTYSGTEAVFSMYIRRKQGIETEFRSIIEVITGSVPKISDNAPSDIRTKNPILEGSIDTTYPSNSRLRARFRVSTLNCLDEAAYQCAMNYKPTGADSAIIDDEESLSVTVLPGNLQITGARVINNVANPTANMTQVNTNDQLEFTCTGSTGESLTTVIEWFTRTQQTLVFQRFSPSNMGDNVDDGYPSSSVCPYYRTSKLRYTIPTTTVVPYAFRCEVVATGTTFRAYSQEFHIGLANLQATNGTPSTTISYTLYILALLGSASIIIKMAGN